MPSSWWRRWQARNARRPARRPGPAPRRFALNLERLEDRTLPAASVLTWVPIGPAPVLNGPTPGNQPVSGRVNGVAADPTNANVLYLAAAQGGVWKTTNAGASWTPLTDTQTTLFMGAIAVAPSNPSVVYAGTGDANNAGDSFYGRGILKSTDAGATWTLLTNGGTFDKRTVAKIVVNPTDPNTVYAAVDGNGFNGLGGNTGIWKSTDGGMTWTNTTASFSTTVTWSDVVLDPNNPATLYAAAGDPFGNTVNGLYKTTNGGSSWSLLTGFTNGSQDGRITLSLAKSSTSTLYASISSPSTSGLFKMLKTINGGTTWSDLTAAVPNYLGAQGWYDTSLIVDPSNANIVYAGGGGVTSFFYQTTNGGTTWTDISVGGNGNGPRPNSHATAFDANGKLLEADEGGVWRLDNTAPITWTDLNNNLQITQFNGIATHPTDKTVAYGGSHGSGTAKYTGTSSWTRLPTSNPYRSGSVRVDQNNPNTIYHIASSPLAGSFEKSTDGGLTWTSAMTGINTSDSANFYPPYVMDPANSSRLLLGTNRVYETTNGASSWSPLSTPNTNGWTTSSVINSLAAAKTDANTIYASAANKVFVTTTRGASWVERDTGLPTSTSAVFSDLLVDPTNSQTAYIVAANFASVTGGGHVWRTSNGGQTWVNISSNLPDLPAYALELDPRGPGTSDDVLYVGTDSGVYSSADLGSSWAPFGAGLPNVQVHDLEWNANLGILAAGTYGRGMWELSGTTTTALAASANPSGFGVSLTFTATVTPLVAGTGTPTGNVTFKDGATTLATVAVNGTGVATFTTTSLVVGSHSITAQYAGDGTFTASTSAALTETITPSLFGSPTNYGTGTNPDGVAVADFDKDGKLDLVTANFGADSIGILPGNGDGTFKAAANVTVSGGPIAVAVGDFNRDGNPDLAVADVNSNNLSVLLGNGNGTFGLPATLAVGAGPFFVAVGDFDRDGNADLVSANRDSNNFSVVLGNGNGTFKTANAFTVGTSPRAVGVGDFNGNGKPDWAVTNFSGNSVSVDFGEGTGSINGGTTVFPGTNPVGLTVGDFNGDGKPDLAVANQGSNNVSVLLSNGNGTFMPATNYAAGSGAFAVAAADFNGDGKQDLAVGNNGGNSASVLVGNGDGTFASAQTIGAGLGPRAVATGDFNGDGAQDFVVANRDTNNVSVFLNQSRTATSLTSSPNPVGSGQSVTLTAIVAPVLLGAGTPTGTVTFKDGSVVLGPGTLSGGVATFTTSSLGKGTHSLSAVYGADTNFSVSTSPASVEVVNPSLFSLPTNFASSFFPWGVATGDFNGDGKPDLAVADQGASTLNLFAGNGLGSFTALAPVPVGLNPNYVAVADFNGDGKLDAAVANSTSNSVSVLVGNGNGTFAAPVPYAVGPGSGSVVTGDFNGDGKADLAVADANVASEVQTVSVTGTSGTFSLTFNGSTTSSLAFNAPASQVQAALNILPSVGGVGGSVGVALSGGAYTVTFGGSLAGTNQPAMTASASGGATAAVATAINGGTYLVSLLFGNGDGTFAAAQNLVVGKSPDFVTAADFNGDGKLDLAVANNGDNNVGVLLGNGNGTFGPMTTFGVGFFPNSVAAGDFNGDGKLDLAAANFGSGSVSVLLGSGSGTFGIATSLIVGPNPLYVVVGDFNGDGKKDLAVTLNGNDSVSVLLGNGDGTFKTGTSAESFTVGTYPIGLAAADLNGDGVTDLVSANGRAGNVSVLLNQSGTAVTLATSLNPSAFGENLTLTATVVSIAGTGTPTGTVTFKDGPLVLASGVALSGGTATFSTSSLSVGVHTLTAVYSGDGDYNPSTGSLNDTIVPRLFSTPVNLAVGSLPVGLAAGDFSGDGKPDLVTANQGGNSVSLLPGNGNGTFAAASATVLGTSPYGVTAGDFDGDGKLDLATANGNAGTVSVLLGNGTGTFKAPTTFAVGTTPYDIITGDFNSDSKLDLVTANNGSNNVSVLLGNGNGTFAARINTAVGTQPGTMVRGDFNGDGKQDLAVVNTGSGTVSVLLGNGSGGFSATPALVVGLSPTDLVAADFNGDGKLDLAVANNLGNSLSLFLGNGDGSFAGAGTLSPGNNPNWVVAADFNGDGKLDLASANGGNRVGVFLGNGDGTFGSVIRYLVGTGYHYLTAADLNADGRPDLAVTNGGDNTVSVLLNQTPAAPTLTAASDAGRSNTDHVTNVTTPTFTGTASPNATVTLFANGGFVGQAAANTSGVYTLTAPLPLASGTYSITMQQVDTGGNVSPLSPAMLPLLVIDTTAPAGPSTPALTAASDSGSSATDHVTKVNTPVFQGAAEANALVQVFAQDAGTSTFAASGNQVNLRVPPSGTGGSGVPAQDTTASTLSVSGVAAGHVLTNVTVNVSLTHTFDGDLIFTLTAPDGTTVLLSSRHGGAGHDYTNTSFSDQAGTAIAAGNPPFTGSFRPDGLLRLLNGKAPNGTWTLQVTDAAAGDTGTLLAWSLTLQTGVLMGQAVADSGGNYQVQISSALPDGSYQVSAQAIDLAGNNGPFSAVLSPALVIDTSPPGPVSPRLTAATDSGPSSSDGVTNHNADATFTGTAEASATVQLYASAAGFPLALIGSGTADAQGNFTIPYDHVPPVLPDGTYQVTARQTDVAGNLGLPLGKAGTLLVGGDSGNATGSAPGGVNQGGWLYMQRALENIRPNVTDRPAKLVVLGTVSGTQARSAIDSAFNLSNLPGNGWTIAYIPAASLDAFLSGQSVGGVSLATAGILYLPTVNEAAGDLGDADLTVVNRHGSDLVNFLNTGGGLFAQGEAPVSSTVPAFGWLTSVFPGVTVQPQATPQAPVTTTLTAQGQAAFPNLRQADLSTSPANDFFGGNLGVLAPLATVTTAGGGSTQFNLILTAAGGAPAPFSLTIDTTAPAAPPAPTLVAADDTGSSASDHVTRVTTPRFSGTAEPGATVLLLIDGAGVPQVPPVVADGAGKYQVQATTALAAGTHAVTVQAVDAAGNAGPVSAALTPALLIDTTAPAAPSVPSLLAADDTGTSNSDHITSVTAPRFAGTAEANATVQVFANGNLAGQAAADGLGNYLVQLSSALPTGATYSITAQAVDAAGNASAASAALTPVLDVRTTGSISGQAFQDVNGNGTQNPGDAGLSGWTVFLDTNNNGSFDTGEPTAGTDAGGNYTFSPVAAGTYHVRERPQVGWVQTTTNPPDVVIDGGSFVTGVNFGNFQLVSISGQVFNDVNSDGTKNTGEAGLAGWTIFLDANNNGGLDAGETSTLTDGSGNFTFANVGPGLYRVREVVQGGYTQTTTNPPNITTSSGVPQTGVTFGDHQQGVNVNTTTMLTGPVNNPVSGQSAMYTATVTASGGPTPTGTVTFTVDGVAQGVNVPLTNGTATFSIALTAAGAPHPVSASYNGAAGFNASTSVTLNQTVSPAGSSVAVTASVASPVVGQSIIFTATVTALAPGAGTPTGSVTFREGASVLGVGNLDNTGTTTLVTSNLPLGPHTITAAYNGDANFTAGSGTVSRTVGAADTTTVVTGPSSHPVTGQLTTFTATVSAAGPGGGTPTGSVVFKVDSVTQPASPLSGGTATFSTSALLAGPHTVSASYVATASYNMSTSNTAAVTVDPAMTTVDLVSSANPSVVGGSVTFTATVHVSPPGSGTPTGGVLFLDGATTLGTGTLNGSGVATLNTAALTLGGHSITAQYNGDANFTGSTSPALNQTVSPAATTTTALAAAPAGPSAFGQSVTFTATVSTGGAGTATGTVTFKDGATTLGNGTLTAGSTTFLTSGLAVGGHTITAVYGGDASFAGSTSAGLPYTVNASGSSTTLSTSVTPSVAGQTVTVTALVAAAAPGSGRPTGTVTFKEGTTVLRAGAALDANGFASFSTSTLAVGSHPITAIYSGDTNFTTSTAAALTQVVNRADTTVQLDASPNPSTSGQAVTLAATVGVAAPGSGAPTGTVTFLDGTTSLGVVAVGAGGTAPLVANGLAVGGHSITAQYGGDASFKASASAMLTVTVNSPCTRVGSVHHWTGAGAAADSGWSNPDNWAEGAPDCNDTLDFPAVPPNQLSSRNDLPAGTIFTAITFEGGGYALAGNPLLLSGGVTDNSAAGNTIDFDVTLTAAQTFSAQTSLTFGHAIDLGTNALTVSTPGGATVTLQGVVRGTAAGSLAKAGPGVLVLAGASTYLGPTTIKEGVVDLKDPLALGDPAGGTRLDTGAALQLEMPAGATRVIPEPFTINGGTNAPTLENKSGAARWTGAVTLSGAVSVGVDAGSLEFNGAVGGSGSLAKQGPAPLTLSGANTYGGVTTVAQGPLVVASAGALGGTAAGTAVSAGATLQLQGGVNVAGEPLALTATPNSLSLENLGGSNVWGGTVDLTGGPSVGVDAGMLELAGLVRGAGGFTKLGPGVLALSGNNAYTGVTAVNAGAVLVKSANALGATAGGSNDGTTVSPGAALQVTGGTDVGAESLTLSGSGLGGAGALESTAGTNGWDGTISLQTTTTVVGVDAGLLSLDGSLVGGGGLTKLGAGTLVLNGGGNAFSGSVGINAGTLRLGGNGVLPGSGAAWSALHGATFDLSDGIATLGSLEGDGTVILGTQAGTLSVGSNGRARTFSGVITGKGDVHKVGVGTWTLAGANSYSGKTVIEAGTLQLGAAGVLPDTSDVTAAAGATFDLNDKDETIRSLGGDGTVTLGPTVGGTLTVGGNGPTPFGGVLSGKGGLVKVGTGTLTLTKDNDGFSGVTTVRQGTLAVRSNNALGAGGNVCDVTVAAGAVLQLQGTLTIGVSLCLAGTLENVSGASTWTGPITLQDGTVQVDGDTDTLTLSGLLGGAAGFTKAGGGALAVSHANTYRGLTTVQQGLLKVSVDGALGTADAGTVVGSGATLLLLGGVTYNTPEPLALNRGTLSNANSNTFAGPISLQASSSITSPAVSGTLTLTGGIDLGAAGNVLTFGVGNTVVQKAITGAGGLQLSGDAGSSLTLLATSTFSGPTNLLVGSFFIKESTALPNSTVTVSQGATIGGIGTVGSIVVKGGHLSPGNSPGILQTNNGLVLDVQSAYDADIDGYLPGQGFDSVIVNGGTVVIRGGSSLNVRLAPSFVPKFGDQFTILQNPGGLPIQGAFAGLPEGATFPVGGLVFQISYQGGAGHDIVLTRGVRPVVTVTSSSPTALPGQALTFTATVSGAGAGTPTGTVVFADGATVLSPALPLANGQATFMTDGTHRLALGNHAITAGYAGDNTVFFAVTSPAVPVSVVKLGATITLVQSATSVKPGESVTFTATVSPAGPGGGTPTGTLAFAEGDNVLQSATLTNGQATFTTTTLPEGGHNITAGYSGDDVYAGGVSAAAAVTVEKAPPAVHRSTPGIYDPSSAHWYLRTDNSTGPADFGDFSFGVQGLIPLAGDYIYPDGREGLALYNPATGIWLLTDNGEAQKPFQFGPGGLPFTIDFNGDGKDGVGLYNNGTWIIGDDVITTFSFGVPGLIPVAGDFNGDGRDGVGLFDPVHATWFLTDGGQYVAFNLQFGGAGWVPLVGDWDGSGKDSIGVFDPTSGTWFLRDSIAPGAGYKQFSFGAPGWLPVVGDWNGKEAQAELAAALPPPGTSPVGVLAAADLARARAAALARFAAAGLDAASLDQLRAASLMLADLPGRELGLQAGQTIWIDADAAGYGWFTDPTPLRDEEFAGTGPLTAPAGSPAASRMDLITVLEHEYGHVLGLPDRDGPGHANDLMADTLTPGTRRLFALDTLFADRDV